ncbi:MAG: hypothetical protein IJX08_07530 [Clostridia bacterium]|nr:hypothetical protein [Clostridia bacterium]MBQ8399800.1 hypothetical protein [Clostridia bacterium]
MSLSCLVEPADRDWINEADILFIRDTVKVYDKTEKRDSTQVIGLQTKSNLYFLICDGDECALRNPEVLSEMKKRRDTRVLKMVCIIDGCPSQVPKNLLEAVQGLNKGNKDTEILIMALKKYPLHTL